MVAGSYQDGNGGPGLVLQMPLQSLAALLCGKRNSREVGGGSWVGWSAVGWGMGWGASTVVQRVYIRCIIRSMF